MVELSGEETLLEEGEVLKKKRSAYKPGEQGFLARRRNWNIGREGR